MSDRRIIFILSIGLVFTSLGVMAGGISSGMLTKRVAALEEVIELHGKELSLIRDLLISKEAL